MAVKGWIHKYAFEDNALSADALGRSAMEDGYLTTGKIASSVYYRTKDVFLDVKAADADGVRSNEDLSAAVPIAFTITNQPDVPRSITWAFDSHLQITAFILVIVGVDAKGNTVTETFTQADGWSGETAVAFATITSITLTARTGTGAGDTMDIGIGSKLGLSNAILAAADVYKVTKNKANYPAASYTVDATNDTVDVSTGGAIVADDDFVISYKSSLSLAS